MKRKAATETVSEVKMQITVINNPPVNQSLLAR
jgi:hypothetical protein